MKKIIAFVIALLGALFCCAANDSNSILSKIEKAKHDGAKMKFTEVRTSSAKVQITVEGELEFKSEGYLRMDYTNGDLFLIDGDKMTIRKKGQEKKFDTSKNIMMKALSHVLIYAFEGTPGKIGPEQDADVVAEQENDVYKVSITARKKLSRGYSRIIIRYRKSDCSIFDMQMDEVSGASTYYSTKK